MGGGGREHAIGWKLRQSSKVKKLFFAPGNAGTAEIGENISAAFRANRPRLLSFIKKKKINLVVIGPDDLLAHGLVDYLKARKIKVFGPTKAAAKIEWSKIFAKRFMLEERMPTASYTAFSDFKKALAYTNRQKFPLVIKADGLALGKGVAIVGQRKEAAKVLRNIFLKKIFGKAGRRVVIEEYLKGKEISIHAFCDGKTAVLFPPSKDYKRVFDKNKGPNTGGMGAISPVPSVSKKELSLIMEKIILPAMRGLRKRGSPFTGVMYPGIILTKEGPKVIEFNARFGDPETQVYMLLLESDLTDIFLSCVNGKLSKIPIRWSKDSACCVVLASKGYPGFYKSGLEIKNSSSVQKGAIVFHASTEKKGRKIITNGGRVLGITSRDKNLKGALKKAYKEVKKINFKNVYYRKDIGKV